MKIKKSKFYLKFWILICNFGLWILIFGFFGKAYALNLDKVKYYFLSGDYAASVNEGEKILANAKPSSEGLDELYYLLGLGYLKNENYLRASDIFEIIIKEFKNSKFREDAELGLGDAYFLRGDYAKAEGYYQGIIRSYPRSRLLPAVYFRLAQAGFKKGETEVAKGHADKLQQGFPLSPEAALNIQLPSYPDYNYTVQIGSFSKKVNAQNLAQGLIQKGYPAFIEETKTTEATIYRVRVGKLSRRQEAQELEGKLLKEGYPTKIFP